MKLILLLTLISMAFAQDDLSKAFEKRSTKTCVQELSDVRKFARNKAGILDQIEKVEIGKGKEEYALLYLKLKDGSICSEQPSKNKFSVMTVRYMCRDKKGKETLEKSVDAGHADCPGDAPKLQ